MKSSTYKQSCLWQDYPNVFDWDKISNKINELFPKKEIIYKKEENGLINKVQKNDMFLEAYQRLYKGILARKHTFTLDDLQSAYIACLTAYKQDKIDSSFSPYKALKKACFHRFINRYKESNNFSLLKEECCDYVIDSRENGITDSYISEVISAIEKRLELSELEIFKLKYVLGYSQNEIAKKLDMSQGEVSKELNRIENKIDSLKVAYFYESRYATYQSKKHRKYLRFQENKEENGSTYKVDTSSYIPQSKCQFDTILPNKALQYPSKEYFKRDLGISYDSLHNGKMLSEYITNKLYSFGHNMPENLKKYVAKKVYRQYILEDSKTYKKVNKYRIKRLWRQFARCHSEVEVKKIRNKVIGE